jgi:hypothetical protein
LSRITFVLLCAVLAGCGGGEEQPDGQPLEDSTAIAADSAWPGVNAGNISIQRSREIDFTRDGRNERIDVTARGPRYDSLDIALVITGADGDTLWREDWTSLHYFKYVDINTRTPDSIARVVQAHVDTLLHDSRFSMAGGLPALLRRTTTPPEDIMREALAYHLAELDWRLTAGLRPSQPTPPAGYSAVSSSNVPAERVSNVLQELASYPSFMYYAGGEATYAIAWSGLEKAFVRIYSCC